MEGFDCLNMVLAYARLEFQIVAKLATSIVHGSIGGVWIASNASDWTLSWRRKRRDASFRGCPCVDHDVGAEDSGGGSF